MTPITATAAPQPTAPQHHAGQGSSWDATVRADVRIDSRPAAVPAPGVSQATYWRRRLTVLAGVLTLALLLVALVGNHGAEAELADPVGGHVVIEPGQTLQDIAAATAPDGVRVADHLSRIRDLNGFDSANVGAWTVVLLPAS